MGSGVRNQRSLARRKILLIGCGAALGVILLLAVIVWSVLRRSGGCVKCMAVASDNDVCTQIGADILSQGGSAVDVTIATLLCLGAVQPQSNGIGGGGFMLIHTKKNDTVINFRERAPAAATGDMYVADKTKAINGALASGIPGSVKGHWMAHQKFGKLPWADLFTPSIKVLREGIIVTQHMENALRIRAEYLFLDKNMKETFFTSDSADSYKRQGQNFTNLKLANLYEKISIDGPDAFYKGQAAENIVSVTGPNVGGIMELSDLANYSPSVDEPFSFKYRGHQILSAPPPASGHVIALVLQLLDSFNIRDFPKIKAWNFIIEAMRFGYAMRSKTGDMEFSQETRNVFQKIKNHTYADNILESEFRESQGTGYVTPHIDINQYSDPIFGNYDGTHTTHVSVLGNDGEAVSCTSTVNLFFGSCIMTDDGVVMNNEMDDFSTPGVVNSFGYAPSPENFIQPGKRPMSSSSPVIVFNDNGEATFVSGAAGGSRIISGTLLFIINAIDWDMTLEQNFKMARIHDQLSGETLYEGSEYGVGLNQSTIDAIQEIGYNMTERSSYMSVVTSVSRLRGETEASGDPRKAGTGRVV